MHDTLRRLALPALAALACAGDPPPGPDSPRDTIPPVIVSLRPPPGDTGVLRAAAVRVTFSEPLNWATVGPASFGVRRESEPVPGRYQVDRLTAAFIPVEPFESLTVYTATVTRGLRDSAGNQLPADSTWSFRTGGDVPPSRAGRALARRPCGGQVEDMRARLAAFLPVLPVLTACGDPVEPPRTEPVGFGVVASAPENGAVGVARAAFVTVTFSAPPDPATVHGGTVGMWKGPLAVPVSVSVEGAAVTVTPRSLLELNTTYVVTVSRTVHDSAGRAMPTDFRLEFTTKRSLTGPD